MNKETTCIRDIALTLATANIIFSVFYPSLALFLTKFVTFFHKTYGPEKLFLPHFERICSHSYIKDFNRCSVTNECEGKRCDSVGRACDPC